ncbi:hypothetical protein HDU91_005155 [Kappamyces sp. JEL0680]|nr:hypothetical protein HDU91_005155 [Kappamyces sp. JEL0680]
MLSSAHCRCLDFVSAHATLSNVVTDFGVLRCMEALCKCSHLELSVSIGVSIPVVLVMKDRLDVVEIQSHYAHLVHVLEDSIMDLDAAVDYYARKVYDILEIKDMELTLLLTFTQCKSFTRLLLANMFVGYCSLETTMHIFDQLIQCSRESNKDPALPRIETWITWICTSILVLAKPMLLEKSHDTIQLLTFHTASVTAVSLAECLEKHFVRSARDALYSVVLQAPEPRLSLDDVVSVSELDLIALEEPSYLKELELWNKKRTTQKKARIQLLMKHWKIIGHGLGVWAMFLKAVRHRLEAKKLELLKASLQKQRDATAAAANSAPNPKKDKAVEKKTIQSFVTGLSAEGDSQLNQTGRLLEILSGHMSFLFGVEEPAAFLSKSGPVYTQYLPSPFITSV